MTRKKALGASNKRLWLRIWAELGSGSVTEAFLSSKDSYIDGMCDGTQITVNPVHPVVDTLIHELLHRMYPDRSERSVRRTTSMLRKTLTDDEVQLFYEEYQRRRKRGRPRSGDI